MHKLIRKETVWLDRDVIFIWESTFKKTMLFSWDPYALVGTLPFVKGGPPMERGMSHCGQGIMAVQSGERHTCLETAQTPAKVSQENLLRYVVGCPWSWGTGPTAHPTVECWWWPDMVAILLWFALRVSWEPHFKRISAIPFPSHLATWYLALVVTVVVQSLSRVWLFATPWTAVHQASLSFTISRSLLKLMSTESVMPSSHLILPLLLPPSIFPSIRVFSNESALFIRWPKY